MTPLLDHLRWVRTHGREGRRLTQVINPLPNVDLRGAILTNIDWCGADLQRSDLRWAVLTGARLQGVRLTGDARGADLQGADLREADLTGADLRTADLRGADLRGAQLFGVRLDGAWLAGAQMDAASLNPACLDATMRDVQTRAVASGGLEWIRQAITTGDLRIQHLSANGQGLAARFMSAMPAGARPDSNLFADRLATWLREAPPWDWSAQLAAHAVWLESAGRAGERLAVLGADLRQVELNHLALRFAALPRADLTETCINGVDLRDADLTDARLVDAKWTAARLDGADLTGADICRARIEGSSMSVRTFAVVWDDAIFPGRALAVATNAGPDYTGQVCVHTDWTHHDLRGADFTGAQLVGAHFKDADLSHACLNSAMVGAAQFGLIDGMSARGAALAGSAFGAAEGLDLRGADLRNTTIDGVWRSCDLRGAVLGGADLRRAGFIDCDLRGVMLNEAQVAGACFDTCPMDTWLLMTADVQPIEAAFRSLEPSQTAAIRAALQAGRPAAWSASDTPIVHAWLVTLGAGASDLHTLTLTWLSTT